MMLDYFKTIRTLHDQYNYQGLESTRKELAAMGPRVLVTVKANIKIRAKASPNRRAMLHLPIMTRTGST